MKILAQMVSAAYLDARDELYFEFKTHVFFCKISDVGVLYDCSYTNSEHMLKKACFEDCSGFDSLTHWTDTCVQDICGEYVTRFSAWKRVRISKNNRILGELRDNYRRHTDSKKKPTKYCCRCDELSRLNILLWQQNKLSINILKSWRKELMKNDLTGTVFESQCKTINDIVRSKLTPYVLRSTVARKSTQSCYIAAASKVGVKRSTEPIKTTRHVKRSCTMNVTDVLLSSKADNDIERILVDETISDEVFNNLLISFLESKKQSSSDSLCNQ